MNNQREIKKPVNKLLFVPVIINLVALGVIYLTFPLLIGPLKTILYGMVAVSVLVILFMWKGKSSGPKKVLAFLSILVALPLVGTAYVSLEANSAFDSMIVDGSGETAAGDGTATGAGGGSEVMGLTPVDVRNEPFNILVSGIDTRADEIDVAANSDVVMLITINPQTGEVIYTSLPRDTYYPLSCTGTYDKLTHATLEGMDCYAATVSEILDTEINYYVKVNFSAVINAIDAVGGITVDVDQAFCGQDELDNDDAYCFTPGEMELDGSMALSYARERKALANGDYDRANHQQQVVTGFIWSVMSNPLSLNSLFDVAGNSMRTNMSQGDMNAIIDLMFSSDNMASTSQVVDGYGDYADIPSRGYYGLSVQILDQTSLANAQNAIASVLGR